MAACLTTTGDFGNASSATHVFGQRAAARIETARAQVAALIGAEPDEITFTSGATESNNLAILGMARANADRGRHIITTRIEHKAVLDPCKRLEREGFAVTYLTPDRQGSCDVEAVRAALRPDTILVSVMYVNNEIGVIAGHRCDRRLVPRARRRVPHGRGAGGRQDPDRRADVAGRFPLAHGAQDLRAQGCGRSVRPPRVAAAAASRCSLAAGRRGGFGRARWRRIRSWGSGLRVSWRHRRWRRNRSG